jgi:hypothetical protein
MSFDNPASITEGETAKASGAQRMLANRSRFDGDKAMHRSGNRYQFLSKRQPIDNQKNGASLMLANLGSQLGICLSVAQGRRRDGKPAFDDRDHRNGLCRSGYLAGRHVSAKEGLTAGYL